ncbi:MAG: type VI secretion system baseplate subunit TssK [Planctomycetes bacterium]|nr:type VI secretion system baseplate subunit TssK [Planctomycetota bacterium]
MTVRSVHWHEGMSLWPHHMQQAERFVSQEIQRNGSANVHYNWGLRHFELDLDSLGNFRFEVKGLCARLRDGTLLAVPEDTNLPVLDLKDALERQDNVTVLLAIPQLRLGKANTAEAPAEPPKGAPPEAATKDEGDARYWIETRDFEDENTGVDSQSIQVRRLHVKLLLSTQNQAGYEVLPLARVKKSMQPGGKPELDVVHIPPLLACEAWKPLRDGILQVIFDRFGSKITKLASQIATRGISFDTRNPGDAVLLAQLQCLNEAYSFLRVPAFAEGIHPLPAYLELCRLAGKLAIFDKTNPRAPDLPRYDHDDLGGCFYRVKQYLDSVEISEPIYEERPFIGEELRMQVALEPKWLEPIWEMYVGVHSPLKAEDCIRLLTKAGQLDMKIGSSSRVDEIFDRGSAGLKFTPSPAPPRALPSRPDLVFFQVSRESQQAEWQHVQKSLTLAIRLNQQRIAGTIQGQRTLTIKTGSQTATMQFTLFLAPRES